MAASTWCWGGTSSTNPAASNWINSVAGTYGALASGDVAVIQPIANLTLTAIGAGTQQAVTLAALYINDFSETLGTTLGAWEISSAYVEINQGSLQSSSRIRLKLGGYEAKVNVNGTTKTRSDSGLPVCRLEMTNTASSLYVSGSCDVGVGVDTPGQQSNVANLFASTLGDQCLVTLGAGVTWSTVRNSGADLVLNRPSSTGTLLNLDGTTILRGQGTNGTITAVSGTVRVDNRPASSTVNALNLLVMQGGEVDWRGNPSPALVAARQDSGGTERYASPAQVTYTSDQAVLGYKVTRQTSLSDQ